MGSQGDFLLTVMELKRATLFFVVSVGVEKLEFIWQCQFPL